MVSWSQDVLARRSGVSIASIRRIELQDGIPRAHTSTLDRIQTAFQNAGISFSEESDRLTVELDISSNSMERV